MSTLTITESMIVKGIVPSKWKEGMTFEGLGKIIDELTTERLYKLHVEKLESYSRAITEMNKQLQGLLELRAIVGKRDGKKRRAEERREFDRRWRRIEEESNSNVEEI